MDPHVPAMFATLVVLMACSGFFSSSESALFSLNPLHLRRVSQRNPGAGARLHRLLAQPTRLLSTILIGNTVVNVAMATVAFSLAEHFFPSRGEAVSIPVLTLLLLVFGEAGPKRVGLLLADRLAVLYAPALQALEWVSAPVRFFLERITHAFGAFFRPRGRTLSEEEFEGVLEISGEEGILNADELAMIKAITHLEDLRASDVMTPRVDLIGLDLAGSPAAFAEKARQAKKNFLLLYRENMDSVEGLLDVRKYLLDPEHSIDAARIEPYFVPENSPLNRLFMQFQKQHLRVAVVADEYGGTAGVITRGDILEEITGDIYNELSRPRPLFQPAGPHRWLVDANINLAELNRALRIHLHAEGADRLAGWIAAHLGRVPAQGDVVETQGCRVTVEQTLKLRVTLAQIEKTEVPE